LRVYYELYGKCEPIVVLAGAFGDSSSMAQSIGPLSRERHPWHARHGGTVVGLVGAGRSREEILREYPYLEPEDITEGLSYAAWRAEEVEVPLRRHF
jgi:hypothetical protein